MGPIKCAWIISFKTVAKGKRSSVADVPVVGIEKGKNFIPTMFDFISHFAWGFELRSCA